MPTSAAHARRPGATQPARPSASPRAADHTSPTTRKHCSVTDVKIGVQIPPQHAPYARLRAAWVEADELGADTIFGWDHFFPLSGDADGLHFEGWTTLA